MFEGAVSSFFYFFFCKQKTAYEMRISDWSSDVCSSDLLDREAVEAGHIGRLHVDLGVPLGQRHRQHRRHHHAAAGQGPERPLDDTDGLDVERHAVAQLAPAQHQDLTPRRPPRLWPRLRPPLPATATRNSGV